MNIPGTNIPSSAGTKDDAATNAGAIKYVRCGFCGAAEGYRCSNRPWFGINAYEPVQVNKLLPANFAHYMRRAEYHQGIDLYWPEFVIEPAGIDDILGASNDIMDLL